MMILPSVISFEINALATRQAIPTPRRPSASLGDASSVGD
jgi:hypothetical protein